MLVKLIRATTQITARTAPDAGVLKSPPGRLRTPGFSSVHYRKRDDVNRMQLFLHLEPDLQPASSSAPDDALGSGTPRSQTDHLALYFTPARNSTVRRHPWKRTRSRHNRRLEDSKQQSCKEGLSTEQSPLQCGPGFS